MLNDLRAGMLCEITFSSWLHVATGKSFALDLSQDVELRKKDVFIVAQSPAKEDSFWCFVFSSRGMGWISLSGNYEVLNE